MENIQFLDRIEHLIILMMENRSFDHYLGALSLPEEGREARTDVYGLSQPLPALPDLNGQLVQALPMDGGPFTVPDPPHGWEAAHLDYNGGRNDGFVQQYQNAHRGEDPQIADPHIPVGYYTYKTLPVLYQLADRFTICDHWFGPVLSSTWPNRKYLHSGRRDDDNDTQSLPPLLGFRTPLLYDVLEDASDPTTKQRLTWRCYFSDLPFLAFWYEFAAMHLRNFTHIADFVRDCQEDHLPTVSIIDPPFTLADDHPAHDPRLGEKFIGLIIDALTHTDSWKKSALLILYDENGGFYDHVPPPPPVGDPLSEDTPLGFRVPAVVVSPYAKRRYCSHVVFDHTALLKAINGRWDVKFGDEFGPRWRSANSIWANCFDFSQPALDVGPYTGDPDMIQQLNWGHEIHDRLRRPQDILENALERLFILPELKELDRRATAFNTLAALEQQVIALKRMVKRLI